MKKIVSDHLAAAFFEKKVPKKKNQQPLFYITLICCVLLILFLIVFGGRLGRTRRIDIGGQHILLEKHDGPYVLNFNFPDATTKVEALVIDVPDMGLSNYKFLKFSARLVDVDSSQKGTLCVGLTNRRNETSSFYISDINRSWKKIKVPFARFDKIHDWSGVFKLSFTLEEWNQSSKKGKLLVDGLEFSKN
jgi:hypothetical protein